MRYEFKYGRVVKNCFVTIVVLVTVNLVAIDSITRALL